jgi:hypothetical protein
MFGRVDDVDAAAEHRHRRPATVERAAVRGGVDAARHAACDDHAAASEIGTQPVRHLERVRRRLAGADERHRRRAEDIDLPSNPEGGWWIVDGGQGGGITDVARRYCTNLGAHGCSSAARALVPDLK